MLLKNWDPTRGQFEVTFDLPAGLDVETAAVVGDFNDWSTDAHLMERTDDGRLEIRISFAPGTRAQFRYRLDGDRWENDWNADAYVANEFGGEDSLLIVPDAPPSVEPPGGAPADPQAAPKKAGAKKQAAKKQAARKKATAKKAPAKKTSTAAAQAAPKQAGAKQAGKKAGAKKAGAKKAGTKKAGTKKTAAKKAAGGPPAEAG